jgi:hypothetical protein
MKFNVITRLTLPSILPEKGSLITMTAKKDLLEKISLTQDEMKSINLRENEGVMYWDAECPIEIELTEYEKSMLKKQVEFLDQSEAIPGALLDFCLEIIKL